MHDLFHYLWLGSSAVWLNAIQIVSTAKKRWMWTCQNVLRPTASWIPISSANLGIQNGLVRLRLYYFLRGPGSNDNEVLMLQRLLGYPVLNRDFGKRRVKRHQILASLSRILGMLSLLLDNLVLLWRESEVVMGLIFESSPLVLQWS